MRTVKTDQTGRMPRLICLFAGRTLTLLILSCRGYLFLCMWPGAHDDWLSVALSTAQPTEPSIVRLTDVIHAIIYGQNVRIFFSCFICHISILCHLLSDCSFPLSAWCLHVQ